MKSFSIYEAKARLSELLRAVKQGASVLVTERGKPIAKVVPFNEPRSISSRLDELRSRGLLIPAQSQGAFPVGKVKAGALKRFLESRE